MPRVQRGFGYAGISSVSDTFVSPPLGNGGFFRRPSVSVTDPCGQLEQGSAGKCGPGAKAHRLPDTPASLRWPTSEGKVD